MITAFIFIFGAIIGSFLNVVILRLGTGAGFGGRSYCFSCRADLKWYELIPILSFFFQRGHCRTCYGRISWQYPVVEMLTGLIFVLVYSLLSTNYLLVLYYWLVFSLLIVISVYDFRHKIIPNKLVYVFIIFSLFSPAFEIFGAVLFLPFFLLWLASKGRAMGLGDAKLALGIGLLLGLSQGVVALLISFWIGAIFGIILLIAKKGAGLKTKIPFGPFLALAAFLVFIFKIDFNAIIQFFTF